MNVFFLILILWEKEINSLLKAYVRFDSGEYEIDEEIDIPLVKGISLSRRGEFESAIKIFEEISKKDVYIRFETAYALFKIGRYEEAEKILLEIKREEDEKEKREEDEKEHIKHFAKYILSNIYIIKREFRKAEEEIRDIKYIPEIYILLIKFYSQGIKVGKYEFELTNKIDFSIGYTPNALFSKPSTDVMMDILYSNFLKYKNLGVGYTLSGELFTLWRDGDFISNSIYGEYRKLKVEGFKEEMNIMNRFFFEIAGREFFSIGDRFGLNIERRYINPGGFFEIYKNFIVPERNGVSLGINTSDKIDFPYISVIYKGELGRNFFISPYSSFFLSSFVETQFDIWKIYSILSVFTRIDLYDKRKDFLFDLGFGPGIKSNFIKFGIKVYYSLLRSSQKNFNWDRIGSFINFIWEI